jgi:phosphatidylglycerol lysyltransferase
MEDTRQPVEISVPAQIRDFVRRIPVVVWVVIFAALVMLLFLREQADLLRTSVILRTADVRWLLLLAAGSLLVQLFYAVEQTRLLRKLGHHVPALPVAEANIQRHAISAVAPFGTASEAYLLLRRLKRFAIPIDDIVLTVVISSTLAHVSFVLVLLPTLGWLSIHDRMTFPVLVASGVLVLMVSFIFAFMAHVLHGGKLPSLIDRRIGLRASRFLDQTRNHGIRARHLAAPLLYSLAVDLGGIGLLFVSLRAIGVHASLGVAAGAFAVGTLFLMLAPIFHGLGVVELSMVVALRKLGVPGADAVAATLLYRVAELWFPLVLGASITAHDSERVRGLPAHVPALMTTFTGAVSVLSVLAPGIPGRHDRIEDYALFDPMDGSRTLALVVGALLLFLSYSLWRRRKVAWVAATALSAFLVAIHLLKRHDEAVALLALANLLLLLLYRSRFRVRSDVPTMWRGLLGFGACLLFALAYGTLGFWLVDERAFGIEFSLPEAIDRTLRLFFNLGNASVEPRTRYAAWFLDSVSIIGVVALACAVVSIGRPIVWRRRTLPRERALAAELISRYDASSLDFFKTWPDKQFFFSSTNGGVISYAVSTATAVALGDPAAADDDEFNRVLREFIDFCDANGWRIAFHQVSSCRLDAYKACGLELLKIGEEAIIDLERFTLSGNSRKDLRGAVNRLHRAGYTATFIDPPLTSEMVAALRAVSDEWLTMAGRRERGFTLGSFDDEYVRGTTVVVLRDPTDRVVAFTNVIPDGVDGETTIDLMRHRADAPNGAMDVLFVHVMQHMKAAGFRRFSLGMAPWADVGVGFDAPLRERAIGALTHYLNRFFSIEGLRAYKAKFQPMWEPRYLVYDGDAALPQVALAIVRLTERGDATSTEPAPEAGVVVEAWA